MYAQRFEALRANPLTRTSDLEVAYAEMMAPIARSIVPSGRGAIVMDMTGIDLRAEPVQGVRMFFLSEAKLRAERLLAHAWRDYQRLDIRHDDLVIIVINVTRRERSHALLHLREVDTQITALTS